MGNEGCRHLELKEEAKKILLNKGFSEKEIFFEQTIFINNRTKRYIIDVFGENEKMSIAIECGNLKKEKFGELKKTVTEVIHLPYNWEGYITYSLVINKLLWEKFKDIVPRSKNLNIALNELIEDKVKRK